MLAIKMIILDIYSILFAAILQSIVVLATVQVFTIVYS